MITFARSLQSALTQRSVTPAALAAQARLPAIAIATTPVAKRTMAWTAVRGSDPSENRRNSEGTMPGAGSTEEIADSKGAFSPDSPRPDQAGSQISSEKEGVDFESSAASNDNAQRAGPNANTQGGKTSSQSGSNPPPSKEDLGGTKAQKKQKQKQ
ncbi:unnamed protein product [Parajaminaea phylloscopi]